MTSFQCATIAKKPFLLTLVMFYLLHLALISFKNHPRVQNKYLDQVLSTKESTLSIFSFIKFLAFLASIGHRIMR